MSVQEGMLMQTGLPSRDNVYPVSSKILSPTIGKHQDWFDEDTEIKALLHKKAQVIQRAYQSDPFSIS